MAVKRDFTEPEIDHYKKMVGIIIDGDEKKKRELDDAARLSVAQAKKSMPGADPATLVTFFSSVAFLMAHLMNAQVKHVAEIIEATFDNYTVAAAHVIGAYDVDGSEVPVKREAAARKTAMPATGSDEHTGQYL
jgi:hypothetical protein